jgi:hypothetical protein
MNEVQSTLRARKDIGDMLFLYAQGLEVMNRFDLGFDIIMQPGTPGRLTRLGRTVVHRSEPPNEERFRAICQWLGLRLIAPGESPPAAKM